MLYKVYKVLIGVILIMAVAILILKMTSKREPFHVAEEQNKMQDEMDTYTKNNKMIEQYYNQKRGVNISKSESKVVQVDQEQRYAIANPMASKNCPLD